LVGVAVNEIGEAELARALRDGSVVDGVAKGTRRSGRGRGAARALARACGFLLSRSGVRGSIPLLEFRVCLALRARHYRQLRALLRLCA
jgi:hypothetical protein